ncbi:MAG: acyltransferase [Hyphomonadaceae bacterium]
MNIRSKAERSFVLLDGVRGLGAIMVLMGHTITSWGLPMPQSGNIVVDAFFLMSGFVLAYAYEPRFAAGMSAGEFMLQRLIRLFPLYLLGTIGVYVIVIAITVGDANAGDRVSLYTIRLIPQLFMLPSPEFLHTKDMYSLNTPAYTLFFELVVNLVYVLIFRWLTMRVLIGLVVVLGVILTFTVFHFGFLGVGSDWATWWGGFPRAGFGFFVGVLAYRIAGSPKTADRPVSWFAIPMLLLLPLVCFIPASAEMRPFIDLTLAFALFLPLLLLGQSIRPPEMLTRACLVAGQISYAVYILQQPIREIYERIDWKSTFLTDTAPAGGIVALVVVLAISIAAEKYYDRPVRRALTKLFGPRPKVAAEQPSVAAP